MSINEDVYFLDNPQPQNVAEVRQLASKAFKHTEDEVSELHALIQEAKRHNPQFMRSPRVGLTMMRAIKASRQDIFRGLVEEGASVNMLFRGRTALHAAVMMDNVPMLVFLLSFEGVVKDARDVEDMTPLMYAARGKPKCLKTLATDNCRTTTEVRKSTSYSIATDGSNDHDSKLYPMVVRQFDENQGQVVTKLMSVPELQGASTAENIAHLVIEQLERFKILLDAGCDMDAKNRVGCTPFWQTICSFDARREDVIRCLNTFLAHGADINVRSVMGESCLQKAITKNIPWLVQWLLMNNCDMNLLGSQFVFMTPDWRDPCISPLHYAILLANHRVVEALIACGCEFRKQSHLLSFCNENQRLHQMFREALRNPDSLQALCRKNVRQRLSTNIISEAAHLGLPLALQHYVLCVEELDALGHY